MIKFLIDKGAKIDQRNKYGFLAYDYAVHGGNRQNIHVKIEMNH